MTSACRFACACGLGLSVALSAAGGERFALADEAPTVSHEASAAAVDALFDGFRKAPGLLARFREEKRIALLVEPLKSEGTVHFTPQKGLARHTLQPKKQSVWLSGSALTFWDGKRSETISLQTSPSLRAFADGFSMLLGADRPGLERNFRLELSGSPADRWRLRLMPIPKSLRALVTEIEVKGTGVVVSTLTVLEASGDVSTTTFLEVDPAHRYGEDEIRALFQIPSGPNP